jgi:hypothetical protein
LKIVDSAGKVLYEYTPPQPVEVADPRLVYQITSVLTDDEARAPTFGRNSALVLPDRPAAVKTGTTDDYRDSWVMGFTPDLVTGVWVGNTDNSPMKDVLSVRGAGQIWHAFMEAALDGTPPRPFVRPPGVVEAEVCALNGLLPTPECRENSSPIHGTIRDVFVPGVNLPTRQDDMHQQVEVCVVNGKRATPLVPPNARESRVFVVFPEPYQAWADAHDYPQPPTEQCDDVYKGERRAEIVGPRATDTILQGPPLQVVGTAYIDDFKHYTLDVGPGSNPTSWSPLTEQRPQAVDKALLGVWNTDGLQPGTYTLRLRVFDSLGNTQEGRSTVTLGGPTPQPSQPPLLSTPQTQPPGTRPPVTATPIPSPTPRRRR